MTKEAIITLFLMVAILFAIAIMPEVAHAQYSGGGFESKMQGLTSKLVTVILPLVSVIGLVYAAILAVTGDGGAKSRIVMVIVCSVIGFLAPHIIGWFQSAAGQ